MAKENIDVTVDLHDRLSRPAKRVEEAVEDVRDEVTQLDAEMTKADKSTSRWSRSMDALRRASGSNRSEMDKTNRSTQRFGILARVAASGGNWISSGFDKASRSMRGFRRMMLLLAIPALASALVLLAGAVSAVGAAGFAAIAGLAPLVGLLGAVPALVSPVVTSLAAVMLGFSNLGDALEALTSGEATAAELAAAMKDLSPAAQAFTRQLAGVKEETEGWRDAIQSAMLPGFGRGLRGLVPIFPLIERGLAQSGSAIGDLVDRLGNELGSTGEDIAAIFTQNERLIRVGLTPTLSAALSIAQDFLIAGGPLAERFARYIATSAGSLADLVAEGRASGRLEAFLGRAGDLAADVWEVLGDISVALYNIGSQSDWLASQMGGGFSVMIADWRAWTESVEGQNQIRDYFNDAQPVIDELGRTLRLLGGAFIDLANEGAVVALLRSVNDQLIPSLANLSSAASEDLGPALVSLLATFLDFVAALSASPLPDLLTGIAVAAGGVVDVVQALPGPIQYLIASLFALRIANSLLARGIPLLATPLGGLNRAFGDARAGAQLYSEGLSGIPRATGAARGAMIGLRGAAAGLMGVLGGPWGIGITAAVTALGVFAGKQQESKARVDELRASLDAQTGALSAQTRELVNQALEDEGLLKKAESLGLSLDLVSRAALGQKDAVAELDEQLAMLAITTTDVQMIAGRPIDMGSPDKDSIRDLQSGLNDLRSDTDSAVASAGRLAAANETNAGAAGASAGQTRGSALAIERQALAADKAKQSLIALNETLIGQQRSYIGFRQNIDDATKTLVDGQLTLDVYTKAGRENKLALLDVAEAASAVENKAQRTKAIKEATRFISDWADKAGMGTREAKRYADRLFGLAEAAEKLPATANLDVNVNGLTAAQQAFQDLLNKMGQVQETAATLVTPSGGDRRRRDGGLVGAGLSYHVGEAGPELFLSGSGLAVIGAAGPQTMTFAESGVVLPHAAYEAGVAGLAEAGAPERPLAVAEPSTPAPMGTGGGGGRGDDDWLLNVPEVHLHFHNEGASLTPAEIKRVVIHAWREFLRQEKERS